MKFVRWWQLVPWSKIWFASRQRRWLWPILNISRNFPINIFPLFSPPAATRRDGFCPPPPPPSLLPFENWFAEFVDQTSSLSLRCVCVCVYAHAKKGQFLVRKKIIGNMVSPNFYLIWIRALGTPIFLLFERSLKITSIRLYNVITLIYSKITHCYSSKLQFLLSETCRGDCYFFCGWRFIHMNVFFFVLNANSCSIFRTPKQCITARIEFFLCFHKIMELILYDIPEDFTHTFLEKICDCSRPYQHP